MKNFLMFLQPDTPPPNPPVTIGGVWILLIVGGLVALYYFWKHKPKTK